ncbi:radical SAM protein [Rhodobacterales bacterium 52_120_T64]|nr:radical SAM protein [Rhodobacterales bacterium 52_120_T64]
MNDQSLALGKFEHPDLTAKGELRASVALSGAKTLWFNTGTLCNITCVNCYIESSPDNDRLVYMTEPEIAEYLDQIAVRDWPVTEIGFTGGEPFMNPEIIAMLRTPLERGFDVLVLTNAMQPMMRKRVQNGLLELLAEFGEKLTLRVSLDHFDQRLHDAERGNGSYDITLRGMRWLRDNQFRMALAGRSVFGDSDASSRAGYAALYKEESFPIDAHDPAMTVLFPEMDETVEVQEITTACWGILDKSPNDVMCATSRMVVKRKGHVKPVVLACTLLPYSAEFEMGETLEDAEADVKLNHRHCAKFCVLGGASCSA